MVSWVLLQQLNVLFSKKKKHLTKVVIVENFSIIHTHITASIIPNFKVEHFPVFKREFVSWFVSNVCTLKLPKKRVAQLFNKKKKKKIVKFARQIFGEITSLSIEGSNSFGQIFKYCLRCYLDSQTDVDPQYVEALFSEDQPREKHVSFFFLFQAFTG